MKSKENQWEFNDCVFCGGITRQRNSGSGSLGEKIITMKNYMYLSMFVAGFAQAQTTNPSPYCIAQYSDDVMNVPHAVERVQFGTLDNSSGQAQYAAPHYVYYSNLGVSVNKGQTLNLTITHDDGTTIHGMAAWIDFNGDHDFDDAGEKVGQTLWPGDDNPATGNSQTYAVLIPTTAVSGTTRMRIRVYEDDDYTFSGTDLPVMPCQFAGHDADWGETEDYNVTISGSTAGLPGILAGTEYTYQQQVFRLLAGQAKQIQVLALNGQLLKSVTDQAIDLSSYDEGIYLVRIYFTDGTSSQVKILK